MGTRQTCRLGAVVVRERSASSATRSAADLSDRSVPVGEGRFKALACAGRCLPVVVGALLLLAVGCASSGQPGSPSVRRSGDAVEELHLITVPVALKLDTKPDSRGFAVKVFAGNSTRPKPFAIRTGTLEILMYDGVLKKEATAAPTALRTWSFSVSELRKHELKASIGVGYQFALMWGEARPATNKITIVVRYHGPRESVVQSTPAVIMLDKGGGSNN